MVLNVRFVLCVVVVLTLLGVVVQPQSAAAASEGASSAIVIEDVAYDAPGDDVTNPNGEWVKLRNRGNAVADLTGWRIVADSGDYSFIDGEILAPGEGLTVFIGPGVDEGEVRFWGNASGILNNSSGSQTLRVRTPDSSEVDCYGWGSGVCVDEDVRGAIEFAANFNAAGDDVTNPNGEWVSLQNTSSSPVDVSGYQIYSPGRTFTFAANTVIPAEGYHRVLIGAGTDSSTRSYSGNSTGILNNTGEYVDFRSPSGETLLSHSWPCPEGATCGPDRGLVISEVNYDAVGNDAVNPNGEWVTIKNASLADQNLQNWKVVVGGYQYVSVASRPLAPGDTITLYMGSGTNTSSVMYWGKSKGILLNSGKRSVRLLSPFRDEVDCRTWGPATCPDEPVAAGTVNYATIVAQAPSEYGFDVQNEYLAEYLRQNPDVSWWNQNHSAGQITALDDPTSCTTTINVQPSGSDDTNALKSAASAAGNGGCVEGNGETFKVSQLLVNTAGVTFRNIPMVPAAPTSSAIYAVQVTAPDVSFIGSPLDLQDQPYLSGFILGDGADRFAMVDGGVSNYRNTRQTVGAMLRIYEGVDDVYIVGNDFINGLAIGTNSKVRGIWYSGPDLGVLPKGGIIASNRFENLQADGHGNDADAFVAQGFDGNNRFDGNLQFLANVGVNGGKRLIKAQSGGIDAHSNLNWWKDQDGPLGVRVTRTHYDNQGTSSTRWTNNKAITDASNPNSETFFMATTTHRWAGDWNVTNVVFDNNIYEHNIGTGDGVASYTFLVFDFDDDQIVDWHTQSSVENNTVRGTGEVRYMWWFRDGADPTGSQFPHANNNTSIPSDISEYRPG